MKLLQAVRDWLRLKIGLREEVAFWDKWMRFEGLTSRDKADIRRQDFIDRQNPNSEFQEKFRRLIDAAEGATVSVLDVGAGPLTIIGKKLAGKKPENF